MAVKHKLIVIIMLPCIVGAAFIGWEWSTFHNNIVQNISTQAEMIAENCKAALAFQDVEDAKMTLSALHVNPSIVFGGVYTKDNKLFATYNRDHAKIKVHPNELQSNGFSFDDGFLNVFKPIILDGEIIGTVCLRSDLEFVHAALKRRIPIIIAVLFLSSPFAAFLVLSGLQAVGNFLVSRKIKIISIIRWLAVLPAAIGAFALSNYVTTIFIYIGSFFEDSVWQAIFSYDKTYQFINSIIGAVAFIWVGTKTAPKYRMVTAISLTGFFCGFVIICLFVEGFLHLTAYSLKWFIICGFVSISTAILTCIELCREIRNKFHFVANSCLFRDN